jgi:hypothetical protein
MEMTWRAQRPNSFSPHVLQQAVSIIDTKKAVNVRKVFYAGWRI